MNSAAPDAAGDATATAAPMNPVLDVEESKAAASDVMVQINDDAGAQVAAVAPGATGGEVHAWLAKLAPPMHQYSARLVDEGFDTLASVRFLTKEDLLHFGIKNGHVRTLLPEINQLRDTWESTHAQRVPLASAGDVEAGAAGPVVVAGVLTPPEAVEDDDEDDEPDTCFGKFIGTSGAWRALGFHACGLLCSAHQRVAFRWFTSFECAEMLSVPWMWAFKTVPDCSQEKYKSWYIVTFTMSIVWIGIISFVRLLRRWSPVLRPLLFGILHPSDTPPLFVFCFCFCCTQILVEMATRLGCAANVSAVLMGLTILAAGTSVPDALGSMVVARQGQGVRLCRWPAAPAGSPNLHRVCIAGHGCWQRDRLKCVRYLPGSGTSILCQDHFYEHGDFVRLRRRALVFVKVSWWTSPLLVSALVFCAEWRVEMSRVLCSFCWAPCW